MKLQFFSIAILFVFFNLKTQAQITLNSSTHNPIIGDAFSGDNIDTAGVSEGNSGTSQTWDFSNIKIKLKGTGSQTYINPANVPGTPSFSGQNLAANIDGKKYLIFNSTSSEVFEIGRVDSNYTTTYSDTRKIYEFPFSYNSTFSDTYKLSYTLNSSTVTQTGNLKCTADGYGTIILPGGINTNALRVKYIDSTLTVNGASTTNVITTTYYYYTASSKFPVLVIIYNEFPSFGFKFKVVSTIKSITNGVLEDFTNSFSNIFPNPFSSSAVLKITNYVEVKNSELKIYNMLGEEVKSIPVNSNEIVIKRDCLENGIYFYSLSNNQSILYKGKFIVD